jgi:hypothetical protein
MSAMITFEAVQELVSAQSQRSLKATNLHQLSLGQILITPQRISVIWRAVNRGKIRDTPLDVWLVGQEPSSDGYQIILSNDGIQFGLASKGFPADQHPIFVGWYGDLLSAFMAM